MQSPYFGVSTRIGVAMLAGIFSTLILLCCAVLFLAAAQDFFHKARETRRHRIRNFPLAHIFPVLLLTFLCIMGLVLLLPWTTLPLPVKKAELVAMGMFLALISAGAIYALGTREIGE